jgi:hypothetical protein
MTYEEKSRKVKAEREAQRVCNELRRLTGTNFRASLYSIGVQVQAQIIGIDGPYCIYAANDWGGMENVMFSIAETLGMVGQEG